MIGVRKFPFCALPGIGSVDPDALKILARRAEYSLKESAVSPFQAELTQVRLYRLVAIDQVNETNCLYAPFRRGNFS